MVDWGLGTAVIQWVEANNAGKKPYNGKKKKNPTMHRTVSTTTMRAQMSEVPSFRNLDLEKGLIKVKRRPRLK